MNERTQAAVAGLAEQAAPYFFGLHSGLPAEWNECGGGGYERFAIPAAAIRNDAWKEVAILFEVPIGSEDNWRFLSLWTHKREGRIVNFCRISPRGPGASDGLICIGPDL